MENSVGSAIEKIKLLEQDKEAKLKEKREYEAAYASLNRTIFEKKTQAEKMEQNQKIITNNINILSSQIVIEKIRHDALDKQLQSLNKELEILRSQSNEGISNVWQQRADFCTEVQNTCDTYDIWALLIKPTRTVLLVEPIKKEEKNIPTLENENRIKAAIERREQLLRDRDLLKYESDNGEEFIRFKNALRYSLEKIEELKKKN